MLTLSGICWVCCETGAKLHRVANIGFHAVMRNFDVMTCIVPNITMNSVLADNSACESAVRTCRGSFSRSLRHA